MNVLEVHPQDSRCIFLRGLRPCPTVDSYETQQIKKDSALSNLQTLQTLWDHVGLPEHNIPNYPKLPWFKFKGETPFSPFKCHKLIPHTCRFCWATRQIRGSSTVHCQEGLKRKHIAQTLRHLHEASKQQNTIEGIAKRVLVEKYRNMAHLTHGIRTIFCGRTGESSLNDAVWYTCVYIICVCICWCWVLETWYELHMFD